MASTGSCSPDQEFFSYFTPISDWSTSPPYIRHYGRFDEAWNATPPSCVPTYNPVPAYVLFQFSLTSNTSLVDPVPSEVNSAGVIADQNGLASISSTVVGIAADGAAEIVVRIQEPSAGTAIQLTLADEDNNPAAAGSGNALGYLTTLLPSDGSGSTANGQPITVTTVAVSSGGAMAFAVYHAPKDFVRDGNSGDPSMATRNEYVEVGTGGTVQAEQAIKIVRPPVAFVHGLWGGPYDGDEILSSLMAYNVGLHTYALDYSGPVTVLTSVVSRK